MHYSMNVPGTFSGTVEGGAPPDLIEPFRFWEHLDVEGALKILLQW